jgi:rhodanese-related sulfurtransferase
MSMVLIAVIAIVIVAVVWYVTSNGQNTVGVSAHQRITPQEYQTGYATRDHLLVDVRTAEEFRTGHIAGAKNIALQSLPQQMAALPKEKPIVVYCRSGARSSNALQMLTEAGFNNVHDLGGLTQWQAQGLPTTRE